MASRPVPSKVDDAWVRFEAAAVRVFQDWTLLNLAIDLGWGGRDSGAKAEQLVEDVLQKFKAQATKKGPVVTAESLSDFLNDSVSTMFNAEPEDESDEEVAELLVELFTKCGQLDFALADALVSGPRNTSSVAKSAALATAASSESEEDSEEENNE